MEEALIGSGVVFLLVLVLAAVKFFGKTYNVPTAPVEAAIVEEIIEKTDEVVEDIKETKKSRVKKSSSILGIILLGLFLHSCDPAGITKQHILDGIDVIKYLTTDVDSAKVKTPIDSIVIKFNPVYYKSSPYVLNGGEVERDTVINGYRIWELQTIFVRRTEIQRLDSVIYLYKK